MASPPGDLIIWYSTIWGVIHACTDVRITPNFVCILVVCLNVKHVNTSMHVRKHLPWTKMPAKMKDNLTPGPAPPSICVSPFPPPPPMRRSFEFFFRSCRPLWKFRLKILCETSLPILLFYSIIKKKVDFLQKNTVCLLVWNGGPGRAFWLKKL